MAKTSGECADDLRSPRAELLAQHERLRELLRSLDEDAVCVIRPTSSRPRELCGTIENVVEALTDHMTQEERTLRALLPESPATARDLASLSDEHARQLEELARMCRCASGSDDAISLALAARAFVADVLLDMDLEERRYLVRESDSDTSTSDPISSHR